MMARLADGPTVAAEVYVAAPPDRVRELVSDITTPARLGGELYEAEWLDGAVCPALGATFVGRNRNRMIGDWETVCRISDYRPARAFGWEVQGLQGDFDALVASWRFELEPENGGTRLRQSMTVGQGDSFLRRAIEGQPERERSSCP